MRVVVVTLANHIDAYLSVTNPALDICAFVADEPNKAQPIAAKHNRGNVPFFPYHHLKECLDSFYFDKVINATRSPVHSTVVNDLLSYDVPNNKIITLINLDTPILVDTLTKLLEVYKQNVNHFKIFVTGVSHTYHAIDINQFKLPAISFSYDSQDIYFDYKIAQKVVSFSSRGGGPSNLH